jgi:hypothetical protein
MNQKLNFTTIISCILLFSLALSSCAESTSPVPSRVPTLSQTPPPTRTNFPSATVAVTATPTLNDNTIILTPDDVFALPWLGAFNTPDSSDFCEHLPPPQIVANPDKLSLLSGRFVLCSWDNWPWVTNTAMDLDTGSFVSKDDERADIVMENAPGGEEPAYGVVGRSNAHINDAYVLERYANHSGANHLSYEYCENMLLDQTDSGGFLVAEGVIACVKTTEGKIALIRVEKIYPPTILSVEFSFVILRDE